MQAINQVVSKFNNQTYNRAPLLELSKLLDDLPAADIVEVLAYYSNTMNEFRAPILDLVRARLDVQLVREHVEAQERMSGAADRLQEASVALARESNRLSRQSNILAAASIFLALVSLVLGWLALKPA